MNAIMAPIAKARTDAEIASLAWHYASLQAPVKTLAAGPQGARQVASYGDNALALPACVNCHGGNITGGLYQAAKSALELGLTSLVKPCPEVA